MGYSISWIAFKDKTPEEATELLALSRTGQFDEGPVSMFAGTKLATGWYLAVINQHGHEMIGENALRRISAGCEVIAACLEEHVMVSSAACWRDGALVWMVAHESESGIEHLEEEGALPSAFGEIKERLLTAQKTADGVDYVFDVPLELAEFIVGYKHDKISDARFETLEEAPRSRSGGLFSWLFGKR